MTDAVLTLVVATTNPGKLRELAALLADLPVDLRAVDDVLDTPLPIAEDGETFEANALHKATVVAEAASMIALADDSGLEVDALGGRPGVRSARFAGARATDAENNAALLAALAEVDDPDARTARFRCVLALVDPWAAPHEAKVVVEGACEGRIAKDARGAAGFGYDPLFVVDGSEHTMAELGVEEKNRLSHRARAFAALAPILRARVDARIAEARAMADG